jgi:hypothetical protein
MLAGLTAVAAALVGVVAPAPRSEAATLDDGLVVHYDLTQTSGTTVTDSSGHGRNGTLSGDATWQGADGLRLGGTNGHVRLPDNVMQGLTGITISAQVNLATDQATPYLIWGLGNTGSDGAGNGYLFTTGNAFRTSIASGNWSTEQTLTTGRNLSPILTSTEGDHGVRDPFVIRSPEGDKFYLIATDLKMYGNGDWDASQRTGSRYIEVWESIDLMNWSQQRHVRVSPDTAGDTWAPEAYDNTIGAYVVFWASRLYAPEDTAHTGKTSGTTTSSTPGSRFVLEEKSTQLHSTGWNFVQDCIGKATDTSAGISRGEGPTVFKSNTEDKWYLFIDEFGGRGYVPFETTDLDGGKFTMSTGYNLPAHPRHGTVLPVTKAELGRLHHGPSPAPATKKGVIVDYEFAGGSGTTVADSSGNGLTH